MGLFGGTFNPVHFGHLILAEFIRTKEHLDNIIFMPAFHPPHKDEKNIIEAVHRLEMLRLAIEDNSDFEASRLEIDIHDSEKSFTVKTLVKLKEMYGSECTFFLIIGMDNLKDFHTWKEPDRIIEMTEVLVIERAGYEYDKIRNIYKNKVKLIDTPVIEISSTEIRRRIKEDISVRYMTPDIVIDYIKKHNLYR